MDKIFDASFAGCIGNEMYIRVNAAENELSEFMLGVINRDGIWTALTDNDHFPLSLLEETKSSSWEFCLKKSNNKKTDFFRLKNSAIKSSIKYTEEMYDRRELFGKQIGCSVKGKKFLPYYKVDGTLMMDLVKDEEVFSKQLKNEIVLKKVEEDGKIILFTKCKKIDGNYIGIYQESTDDSFENIEYDHIEDDENYVYMRFEVNGKVAGNDYEISWRYGNAKKFTSAVPVTESIDSVLYSEDGEDCGKNFKRKNIYITQAPQGYTMKRILDAHEQAEAAGVESVSSADLLIELGQTVHIFKGIRENIKATTPEDMYSLRAEKYYEHFQQFAREELED